MCVMNHRIFVMSVMTLVIEPLAKKRKLGSWLAKAMPNKDVSEPLTPQQKVASEMEQYEKSTRADPSSDPLQWWSINCRKYHTLSQLAK